MKQKCPKCKHRFEDGAQAKASNARWKKTPATERTAGAKKAAAARWKIPKRVGDAWAEG